jgi:hypothetical protein
LAAEEAAGSYLASAFATLRTKSVAKVLLSFGSPLGNAVGDTCLATQHLPHLRHLLPASRMTVWTTSADLWKGLDDPQLDCRPCLSMDELLSFDLLIFDWAVIGQDLMSSLRANRRLAVIWPSWGTDPKVLGQDGYLHTLSLAPSINQPGRIAQLYAQLGSTCAGRGRQGSGPKRGIVLVPCASTCAKSLPRSLVSALAGRFADHSADRCTLSVVLPPADANDRVSRLAEDIRTDLKSRPGTCTIEGLGLADYVRVIEGAAVVIGPDTSSQHIAALLGTPSVAVYRAASGYNHYFFGHQYWPNLQYRLHEQPDGEADDADAILRVARAFVPGSAPGLDRRPGLRLLRTARHYQLALASPAPLASDQGDSQSAFSSAIRATIGVLCPSLGDAMCREAEDLWLESRAIRGNTVPDQRRAIMVARAANLNVVRLARAVCHAPGDPQRDS